MMMAVYVRDPAQHDTTALSTVKPKLNRKSLKNRNSQEKTQHAGTDAVVGEVDSSWPQHRLWDVGASFWQHQIIIVPQVSSWLAGTRRKPELMRGPQPQWRCPTSPNCKSFSTAQWLIKQKVSWAHAYSSEVLLTISSNKLSSFISLLEEGFLVLGTDSLCRFAEACSVLASKPAAL